MYEHNNCEMGYLNARPGYEGCTPLHFRSWKAMNYNGDGYLQCEFYM